MQKTDDSAKDFVHCPPFYLRAYRPEIFYRRQRSYSAASVVAWLWHVAGKQLRAD